MLSTTDKYKQSLEILERTEGIKKLNPSEIFLLGYSYKACKGKISLDKLTQKIVRVHDLIEKGIITNEQKYIIDHLLFEGIHETIDSIIVSFLNQKDEADEIINIQVAGKRKQDEVSEINEKNNAIEKDKKSESSDGTLILESSQPNQLIVDNVKKKDEKNMPQSHFTEELKEHDKKKNKRVKIDNDQDILTME